MVVMEKANLSSMDIAGEKRDILKRLFPEFFVEKKVDIEKLMLVIGEDVEIGKERYSLNWSGKAECIKIIQKPSIGTLKPCPEESVNFDETENLFIEGDNLEVLKLLQKSYYGKVKMIYIDPPYNTGKDFIYPDNYSESLDTYLKYTGQVDSEGRRYSTNAETDGRFHTKWLNMMYPRLYLARNLLKDDGIIFVSIDDREQANLRKILDEIFGEENFTGMFTWVRKKKGSHLSDEIRKMTEYVIAYKCQRESGLELYGEDAYKDKWQPLLKRTNNLKTLTLPGNLVESSLKDGIYKSGDYGSGGTKVKLENDIEIKNGKIVTPFQVTGRYVWTQTKVDEEISLGTRIAINSMGFGFNVLRWNQDEKTKRPSTLINETIGVGTNEDANEEIKSIFGLDGDNDIFSYAKPVSLIKYLIKMVTHKEKNAIILDFFAGSGTTAHAVMELNNEEEGDNNFICIQLPEIIEEYSNAFNMGYKNICDVGKERIRRVSKKMQDEKESSLCFNSDKIDIGFKVFKLDKSNFRIWDGSSATNEQEIATQLELHIDHINPDSSQEDILFEILLKAGFELTTKIEKMNVEGKDVFSVADGALIICLEEELTKELLISIADKSPVQVICLDEGFQGNDQLKTNAVQIMKSKEIEFRTI